MGYNYQLVALSRERFEAIYCSRDEELLARMAAAPEDSYVAHLLKHETTALQCLLVGGDPALYGARPHQLAYAFEACCFELGTSLGSIDSRDVERLEALPGVPALFPNVSEHWPVPIPDTEEWPFVGVLSASDAHARHAALAAARVPSSDPDEMIAMSLEHARAVFADAAQAGTDIIVFFH